MATASHLGWRRRRRVPSLVASQASHPPPVQCVNPSASACNQQPPPHRSFNAYLSFCTYLPRLSLTPYLCLPPPA
ncbi:unnamed protein product [Spirodela intermedia]|uniref:Uncharacterized protein n=1 Tax=Spirodela intermedia TaxID=51605 RepID=A0A7I8JJP6_SPIIN|nr:unnamed protein product [Spirodela intermedia]CAA6669652.1 unnamed protein product [Spirodela intermedia]